MDDRFREMRDATQAAVIRGPGRTSPELRERMAHGEAPDDLQALVAKIRTDAWQVTDDDWAAVAARYSEDELFELVVATVVGTAEHRLRAALRAVEGA